MTDKLKNTSKRPFEFAGHILAIEINDYFPAAKTSSKNRSRIIPNILHLLDHIDRYRTEGNFFITTKLMKDFPEIITLVSSRGHEIGLFCDLNAMESQINLAETKKEMRQLTGCQSIGVMLKGGKHDTNVFLKQLASEGFNYSLLEHNPLSLRNITSPVEVGFDNDLSITVFPSSRYYLWGISIGFGRPGKIRLYPYWFLRKCMRYFTNNGVPAVINFPLWEFDPHLPRQILGPIQSLKSYGNLTLAEFKLTRLLLEFDFTRASNYLVRNNDGL